MANFTLFGELKVNTRGFEQSLRNADAQLRETEKAVNRLERQSSRLGSLNNLNSRSFDKLNESISTQRNRMNQAVVAFRRGEISQNKLSSVLRQTDTRIASFNSRVSDMKSRMDEVPWSQFSGQLRTVATVAGAAGAAFGAFAIRTALSYDQVRRGLTAVTGSAEEAEKQIVRLREIAKLPGLGFIDAAKGSINLQAAGLSAKTAERALMAFGNALAIVGKGRADLDGVTLALTQIANKSRVSAQEINQLSERVPQIRQAMIAAFGTADTEILEKKGVSPAKFIEEIIIQLERLPKATTSAQGSLENLSDALEKAIQPIGQNILDTVLPTIEKLSTELSKENPSLTKAADDVGQDIGRNIGKGIKIGIPNIFDLVQDRIKTDLQGKTVVFPISGTVSIGKGFLEGLGFEGSLKGLNEALSQGLTQFGQFFVRVNQMIVEQSFKLSAGALEIGKNIVLAMATGVINSASSLYNALSTLADRAVTAAKERLGIQSPSQVFMEIGRDVGRGLVEGIDEQRESVQKAMSTMLSLSEVKKAVTRDIRDIKKELKDLMRDYAAFTAGFEQTRGMRFQRFAVEDAQGTFDDLLRKRYETGANLDLGLPSLSGAKEEIKRLQEMQDAVQGLADRLKDLMIPESETSRILNLFDPERNKENAKTLREQAEALGLTVEEFRKLSLIVAPMSESLKSLGLGADAPLRSAGLETSGTGSSTGAMGEPKFEPIELPPPLIAPWENFWATMKDHLNSFKSSLPSIKQSIGENVINSLYGIGDVLGSAVANADGTLRGFFQNVGQGFQRMAQQIIGELLRIAVYQLVLQLFGSVAGAGAGSATRGASAGYYSAKNLIRGFDAGGFTGTGSPKDVAGFVHKREFVMPWEAVKAFGLPFMESIKNLQMPRLAFAGGFDMGGFTGGSAREAFAPDLSQLSSSMRSGQTASTEGGGQTVNHFHFHSRQDGSFSRQSAEQAARAMIAAQNRVVTKSG